MEKASFFFGGSSYFGWLLAPAMFKPPNMLAPAADEAYVYYGAAAGYCINEKALAGAYC